MGVELDCERELNNYALAVNTYRDCVRSFLGLKYVRIDQADYFSP